MMNWTTPNNLKQLEQLNEKRKVPGKPGTYFLTTNDFELVAKEAIPQLINEIRRLRRSL